MEIVTGLSLFRTTKVLASRLMTGNGPSKGGTRGRRTASTRMKTWEARRRAGSTRKRDWSTPWWTTGIGAAARMTAPRLLANSDGEGDGDEDEDIMAPGSRRGAPYRRSEGAQAESSRTEERNPNSTKGRWDIQLPDPEPEAQDRDTSRSLRVLCWRSIMPLDWGW